jgi:hypothetical protein
MPFTSQGSLVETEMADIYTCSVAELKWNSKEPKLLAGARAVNKFRLRLLTSAQGAWHKRKGTGVDLTGLTNRRQRVVLNGKQSSWSEILSGVQQGSVLGPILFLVFIMTWTQQRNI